MDLEHPRRVFRITRKVRRGKEKITHPTMIGASEGMTKPEKW